MLRIVDAGCVSEVAEALGRSQQSIFYSIHANEEALGVRLFERSSLGMHPTREAIVLGQRVRRAIAHLAEAREWFCEHYGSCPTPRGQGIWEFNISNQYVVVFLSLCEQRESRRVAAELNLDVSAVRKAVHALEDQVGQRLFEKASRGYLIPTEFAEHFARQMSRALAEIRSGLDELRSLEGVIQGEVVIGAAPHARSTLLPKIAARLHRKYPKLTLSLRYGSYEDLEKGVRSRDVDFILGSERPKPISRDLTAHPLFSDHLEILGRANHPLAMRAHPEIDEYLRADWVLPPSYVLTRQRFREFLRDHGLPEPPPALETGDIEIVKGVLLETDYLALAMRCECAQEVERGILTSLRQPAELTSFLQSPVALHVTFPPQAIRSPSAQAFFDEAISVAVELA